MCLSERATVNSWSAWVDNDRPTWPTPADRLNVLSVAGGPALSCFSPLAASRLPLTARSRGMSRPEWTGTPYDHRCRTPDCRHRREHRRVSWLVVGGAHVLDDDKQTTDRRANHPAAPTLHRLRFHHSPTNRTELVWLSAWLECMELLRRATGNSASAPLSLFLSTAYSLSVSRPLRLISPRGGRCSNCAEMGEGGEPQGAWARCKRERTRETYGEKTQGPRFDFLGLYAIYIFPRSTASLLYRCCGLTLFGINLRLVRKWLFFGVFKCAGR